MSSYRALTIQNGIHRQLQDGDLLVVGSGIRTLSGNLSLVAATAIIALASQDLHGTGTATLDYSGSSGQWVGPTGGALHSGIVLADGGIDRSTAGALAIGATTATSVTLSRTGELTHVLGALTVEQNSHILGTSTLTGAAFADGGLDRSSLAALLIGGTNASAVQVGRTGHATIVLGSFEVDEGFSLTGTFGQSGGAFSLIGNGASLLRTTAGSLTLDAKTAIALEIDGTSVLALSASALTIQNGVTLDTTGTGNVNLPNNGSARFEIEGVSVGAAVTAANLTTLTNGSNASSLHSHTGATSGSWTTTGLSSGQALYASANNVASACDNALLAKSLCIGFYTGTANFITTDGIVTALFTTAGGSPTTGANVYLAASTDDTNTGAGKLTATPPSTGFVAAVGLCVDNSNYAGAKTCVIAIQRKSVIAL